jgi:hypothetical protein
VDTLLTVPDDPPVAGPDRALDPAPPDPGPRAKLLGDVAVAVGDEVAAQPGSPITAHISAAAAIHPLFLFDGRRVQDRRACSVLVVEADRSGEDTGAGGGAAPAGLPATDGPDVALVSWGHVGA